jgi:response regulator NasT
MERRSVVERAKGILMERHNLEERAAFDMLRREARSANLRIVDAAGRILEAIGSCRSSDRSGGAASARRD